MSLLLEHLLHYSRVSTQARPFEPVDLQTIMLEVMSDLEARLQDAGARVEVMPLPVPVFYHEKVEELWAESYKKIYVLPFLLFTGGFTAKMEMNNENIIVCDPIGFDEKLIPLIQKRANLG
jgi:sirohydrochlorin ferrochelatase